MTGRKTIVSAVLLSALSVAAALADEPAAFQAQYPNRDILNGGQLTPEGRMALERAGGAPGGFGASNAYAGSDGATSSVRSRRHHVYEPGYRGRRHPSY